MYFLGAGETGCGGAAGAVADPAEEDLGEVVREHGRCFVLVAVFDLSSDCQNVMSVIPTDAHVVEICGSHDAAVLPASSRTRSRFGSGLLSRLRFS